MEMTKPQDREDPKPEQEKGPPDGKGQPEDHGRPVKPHRSSAQVFRPNMKAN
jgi:hypothetical protein